MSDEKSKKIIELLFGSEGLSNADSSLDFDLKVREIEENFSENLISYISDKIVPTLRNYILEPRQNSSNIPPSCKNNNCESMNHILKMNIDWKPKKLPDLIEILQKEVNLQEALIKAALHGMGLFELASYVHYLKVTQSVWETKTEEEKK